MYKRKHPERFDAWWRPLTRQGDPSHRYDLVGEAFDAGFEAGKEAALVTLGKRLLEQYATPLDTEGRPRMETRSGYSCEQCKGERYVLSYNDNGDAYRVPCSGCNAMAEWDNVDSYGPSA